MDAATLPDLDQLDSQALKSLILARSMSKSSRSASSSLRAMWKSNT